jgi:predicted lipoprotein
MDQEEYVKAGARTQAIDQLAAVGKDVVKDGGPAFPLEYDGYNRDKFSNPGMTLRDWFAGKVLPQAYAESRSGSFDAIARDAYAMADAMVKAREGK